MKGKLGRIAVCLENYDYDIIHKSGSENKIADFLSRYPQGHKLVDGKNITIEEVYEFEKESRLIDSLIICNLSISNQQTNIITKWQTDDSEIKDIMHVLHINDQGTQNKYFKYVYSNFVLREGAIHKFMKRSRNPEKLQICIPYECTMLICEKYHDQLTAGHLGTKRTIAKLCERFYWPQMNEFIKLYVKTCKICQYRKSPKTRMSGLMQPIVTGSVFEMVAIDHLGPLPKSNGYEYIIVLTDNFSKFAIVKPVTSTGARSVAKFIFEDLILTFGVIPPKFLSDCHKSFMGKIVKHLNILMGIKQVRTSGYKPSTNSITERYNGTLADCLSKYCDRKQSNWSRYVKPLCYAYNATIQARTGYSPIEVIFGRKAEFPPDLELQMSKITGNANDYALGLASYLSEVKTQVFDKLMASHKIDKKRFDSKRKDVQLSVGDKVLFYNPIVFANRMSKLTRRWEGPFQIVRQLSPLLYELDFKASAHKSNVCHIGRLKIWFDRDIEFKEFDENRKPFIPKSVAKYRTVSKPSVVPISDRSVQQQRPTEQPAKPQSKRTFAKFDYSDSDSDSEISDESMSDAETEIYPYEPLEYESGHTSLGSDSDTSDDSSDGMDDQAQQVELSPNFQTEQGLRRSTRKRSAPNRLQLQLATLFCIVALAYPIDSLATVEPIIWHRVDNAVIEGLDTVTTVIEYKSPCYLFNELLINSKQTREMKSWCENLFETNFIRSVNEFCTSVGHKESAKFGLIRDKRFIFTAAIALITIVSVVASSDSVLQAWLSRFAQVLESTHLKMSPE